MTLNPHGSPAPSPNASPLILMRDRMRHMGRRSGYDLLYEAVAHEWAGPVEGPVRDLTDAFTRASDLLCSPLLSRVMGSPFYSLSSLRMEWGVLRKARPSSRLLAHLMYVENDWGLLQRRRPASSGLRVIGTAHQPPDWWRGQRRLLRHLPALDALIVLSKSQEEFFESAYTGRIFHVPHGVDTEFFHPAPQAQGMSEGLEAAPTELAPKPSVPFRCVFAGSYLRDFDALAKIIERTLAREPSIRFDLLVPFRDRYHPALRRLANYEQIAWRCDIPDSDLREIYQRAGALILPLRDGTANNALLEAMACGVPIIATDLPATRDYCDASFATLVPAEDIAGAVDAIFLLAGDPAERAQRSAAARAHAESHFAWPFIAARMMRIYREILSAF